jgi:group I intron endonuclease
MALSKHLRQVSGIYYIYNKVTNKIYIGSSCQIGKRWKRHQKDLDKGIHHNIYLQRGFNKHGNTSMEYHIIVGGVEKENLLTLEEFWIRLLVPEYNIGGVGGGDNFSNHPDKEKLIEVNKVNLQKIRDAGKVPTTGKGDKNPNWRGGISGKNFCGCGNKKEVKSSLCKKCSNSNREGALNSFYGKKHSEETKQLLSEKRTGREVPSLQKSLVGDWVFYKSGSSASKLLSISQGTVTYRVKSKNYPFWYFTEDPAEVSRYEVI